MKSKNAQRPKLHNNGSVGSKIIIISGVNCKKLKFDMKNVAPIGPIFNEIADLVKNLADWGHVFQIEFQFFAIYSKNNGNFAANTTIVM